LHDGAQLSLSVDFRGAIEPLEQCSKRRAVFVGDGVGDDSHMQVADLNLGAMIALDSRK
jgi:hypothetical protein